MLDEVTFAVASRNTVDSFVQALQNLRSEVIVLSPHALFEAELSRAGRLADVIVLDTSVSDTSDSETDATAQAAVSITPSKVLAAFPQAVCVVYPCSQHEGETDVIEPAFLTVVLAELVGRLKTGRGRVIHWDRTVVSAAVTEKMRSSGYGIATGASHSVPLVSLGTRGMTSPTKSNSSTPIGRKDTQLPIYQFDSVDESAIHNVFRHEKGHQLVQAAVDYIQGQFYDAITLTDVARHVHCNATYLSHLFKEVAGYSFVQYLTICRIAKAKQLLQNPKLKVYEVGELVGFPNPRYFSEIFKKYTTYSPYEFRNEVGLTGTDGL